MKKSKKIIKKLLWIIWTPLLLIGFVLVSIFTVFLVGTYSVDYSTDTSFETSKIDYENLGRLYISNDYKIKVNDSNLDNIVSKFNGYIEKIYGNEFEVVNSVDNKYIELKIDATLSDDFKYCGVNQNIVIVANNKDHLNRAAYHFLEEFGGVKCYTSKMIEITNNAIFFPIKDGGYSKSYNDYFEMLDTDFISPKDDEYSWFRGFNSDEYRFFENDKEYYDSMGGRVQYISGFCHTFTSDFVNKDKYYNQGKNLECYAIDGKGNNRQDELCLSNPKTEEIVTEEVFAMLNDPSRYDANAPLQIISLTQSDDLTACKCKTCVKEAKAHGGYSYVNLKFVNKIAKKVKDAGYENVAIDTFAYRYTRSCPTDIVPLDNVIIRLCTIECCSSHYIDDSKCLANKAFMKDLSDWSKICNRIYIWDYATNYSHYMCLFPEIEVLAHNIRIYYENNVKGVYVEGNYSLNKEGRDPEFNELRCYVISKVMQDPYCDVNKVMKEFCNAYYGEAGKEMYDFITLANRIAGRRHLNIYKSPKLILAMSRSEFKALNKYFEDAKALATGDSLVHVLDSEISWRYIKMYLKKGEFANKDTYESLCNQLIEDINACGQSRLHEDENRYEFNGIQQTAIIDLRPLFDLIVGKFIYGPLTIA